jgi:2-methylcitrate dehydratase PrpD
MIHASGKDVLTAIVVGYEVYTRVAQAMDYAPSTVDRVGGVACQTYAAVASSSKVLSLDLDQVLDALGIAGSTAPVQSNAKTGGSEEMPPTMKVGFYQCSLVGTTATLLAKNGITGPHHILDGENGFWRMIGADSCDFDRMAHGLSKEYEIMNVAFKPYSCCRWFHAALDAALAIAEENKIDVRSIQRIDVKTIGGKSNLEYMKNPRPGNIVAAEFSLPYSMAVALHGIKPGPEWFATKTMKDKGILDLAVRIKVTFGLKSESDRKEDFHKWPTTVDIATNRGTFSKRVEYPKGSPKNMLTDPELDAKFMRLAQNVLGEDAARELKITVSRLEQVSDITELTSLLIPA